MPTPSDEIKEGSRKGGMKLIFQLLPVNPQVSLPDPKEPPWRS